MGFDVISKELAGTVIYDNTTDIPLPIQLFPSEDAAWHFLHWAKKEGREPFDGGSYYDYPALSAAQQEWWDRYLGDDQLTEEAREEIEEVQAGGTLY